MKKSIVQLIQVFLVLLILYLFFKNDIIEGFTPEQKQVLFDDFLENHYSTIFPDRGRNSCLLYTSPSPRD